MEAILHTLKKAGHELSQEVLLPILNWVSRRLQRRKVWNDPSSDPIKHVFVLMLENRSFDQVLGCFKNQDDYPKLDGVDSDNLLFNEDEQRNPYYQCASDDDRAPFDPDHEYVGVMEQLKNGHAGFVRNFQTTHREAKPNDFQCVMNFYPKGSLQAIHWLAGNFTICDRWFSSVPGPTWANRLFLLSGTSMGRVEMGCGENKRGFFGYTQHSILNRLDEQNVPWRIYYHDCPQSWLLMQQLHPRMIDNYRLILDEESPDGFESDLQREGSSFPAFCLIEPQYFPPEQNDDHPTSSKTAAQQLIARVYNAIRSNEDIWNSSLLVITYDEHGGFFDHVPPPEAVAPVVPHGYLFHDKGERCDFKTLGVRVPAVLVSPWVGKGVCSDEFDHTSILKYISKKWNLRPLTNRVEAAIDFRTQILKTRRDITDTLIRVPALMKGFDASQELGEESVHQRQLRALMEAIESEELPVVGQEVSDKAMMKAQPPAEAAEEMKQKSSAIMAAIKSKGRSNAASASEMSN